MKKSLAPMLCHVACFISSSLMLLSPAHATLPEPQDDDAEAWEETEAETVLSTSVETWLYSNHLVLPHNSVLNPGNRLGRIPEHQTISDTRFNIKLEHDEVLWVIQPRFVVQRDRPGQATDPAVASSVRRYNSDMLFTQANARWKHGAHTAVLGREIFSWGPANFRSPSNPFYFDSGRTSPLAATPGIDLIRYSYAFDQFRIHAARIYSTAELDPKIDLGQSVLLKLDHQGESHLLSVSMLKRKKFGNYFGGFFQYSPSEAWMIFGEYGSVRPLSPVPPPPAVGVFQQVEDFLAQQGLRQRPPRSTGSSIIGASYTLKTGHTVTGEWMRNQGGLNRRQQQQFVDQIEQATLISPVSQTVSDALVGATLLRTPSLLGRDYLWLSVQSNTQETRQLWRAEVAHSVQDKSRRLLLYGEKTLQSKISVFAALTASDGGPKSEFGAFVRGSVTFGLKVYLF